MLLVVLAQNSQAVTGVWIWVGVLILLAMIGGMAIVAMRRYIMGERPKHDADAGLMDELRAMVERGEMTQEEFDKTRRTIADKLRGTPSSPGDPPPVPKADAADASDAES